MYCHHRTDCAMSCHYSTRTNQPTAVVQVGRHRSCKSEHGAFTRVCVCQAEFTSRELVVRKFPSELVKDYFNETRVEIEKNDRIKM